MGLGKSSNRARPSRLGFSQGSSTHLSGIYILLLLSMPKYYLLIIPKYIGTCKVITRLVMSVFDVLLK